MAAADIGKESWRQTNLGEEPIYCAAPENPDDILCLGSDDGLDESAKVAKRLRYEDQGLRYLRGHPPRLLSASLRGPFDKASGWQNPWLPKPQPTQKRDATSPFPQRQAKKVRSIKPTLREELEKLADRDGTLPIEDSMQCHLPSPDSYRDLQLAESVGLNTDQRSRIQEWASAVSVDTLDKDDFWAPNQATELSHAPSSNKKRPAGKEWLKSKINKRTRASHTASGTASTPTPAPAPKSISRATSVPILTTQSDPSEHTVKVVGRSLDMTTPCSSADKRITRLSIQSSKATNRVHTSTSTNKVRRSKAAMTASASQHILSSTQPPTSTRSAMNSANEKPSGLLSCSNPQFALASAVGPIRIESLEGAEPPIVPETKVPRQQGTQNTEEMSGEQDGEEANTSFESHLDQSFHYRARPTRLESPVFSTAQDNPNCPKSQATQTGTPESEIRGGLVTVQANQVLRNAEPSGGKNSRHEDQVMVDIVLNDNAAQQPLSSEILEVPGMHQPCVPEGLKWTPLSLGMDVDFLATNEPKDTIPPPRLRSAVPEEGQPAENAAKESENPPGDPSSVRKRTEARLAVINEELMGTPMAIIQDGGLRTEIDEQPKAIATGDVQTRVTTTEESFPEALVDEELTLVGDVMDIDQSTSFEMAKPSENADHESGADPSSVTIQFLQMSWGTPQLVTSSPSSRPERLEDDLSDIYIKIEPVDDEAAVFTTSDATSQSPWMSDHFPHAPPDVQYIRPESQEQDQCVPCPRHISVLSTSSLDQQQPELGPLQQCPRSEGLEPAKVDVSEIPSTLSFVSTTPKLPELASRGNGPGSALSLPERSQSDVQEESLKSLNRDIITKSVEEPTLVQADHQPTTPSLLEDRQSTPDAELSIKSFAKFNTPSPKRKPTNFKYPRLSGERLPSTQILIDAANINPWSSAHSQPRSSRRVSFAPLPGEEDGPDEPAPSSVTRAASPPPQSTIEAGDEDIDDNFQNHFNAMRRRSGQKPGFRLRARLLPSSSQLKLSSPEVGAMAEAFRAADAHQALGVLPETRANDDERDGNEVNTAQSPWRNDSQNHGVDDVAAVLQNLEDFLNPRWDIEAEMDKAARVADGIENQGGKHRGEISFPDIGVWDVV